MMASEQSASQDMTVETSSETRKENGSVRPPRLFIMRHGERCDFTFGNSWLKRCLDEEGRYKPFDENLPPALVPRDSHEDFWQDSPLTVNGCSQARATGEAFRRAETDIQHVYSSPALRCVQTAQNVLDGMGSSIKMCIEPTAFEFFGWFTNDMPKWLSPQQMAERGFSVDVSHKPFVELNDLYLDETATEYYNRCYQLVTHLLKKHQEEGGDILIVCHGLNLDTMTRQLTGKPPRSSADMHQILTSFGYCCVCCAVRDEQTGKWRLEDPPIPPVNSFNWRIML